MEKKESHYNPWPLGHVPKELQRPELDQLKSLGYNFNDPRDVIGLFETKVANFAGSSYAVAVDCCTHAIELSLRYMLMKKEICVGDIVHIPNRTYVSVPITLINLGFKVEFVDYSWSGMYGIKFPERSTQVIDCAVRWIEKMYCGFNAFQCLSFQIKKPIPIGRGGMILCDDIEEYEWLKLASYDGRDLNSPYDSEDHIKMKYGFHYYMTPEDAARGIILMDNIKFTGDSGDSESYPDTKKMLQL